MKHSGLLMFCVFACLSTVMDSSSEFHHLAFGPGVTVEGQFLASLAPQKSACVCTRQANQAAQQAPTAVNTPFPGRSEKEAKEEDTPFGGAEEGAQRFWHVMLHDDDEHTLDYAMEKLEVVLRREVGPQGLVRRAKVQWIAYQAHHYGMGLVAVLPEMRARRAVSDLEKAGLACSIVAE